MITKQVAILSFKFILIFLFLNMVALSFRSAFHANVYKTFSSSTSADSLNPYE